MASGMVLRPFGPWVPGILFFSMYWKRKLDHFSWWGFSRLMCIKSSENFVNIVDAEATLRDF